MASEQKGTEIGELIDTLIEQERAKKNQGLTAYLEETVSPSAGLSPRQIGRIRTISSDFPEGDAIQRLSKAIPQASILDPNDIANRLLWDWRNVEYDQENLKTEEIEGKRVGHTVTIFSGWQQPIGLTNEDVVKSIATNIRQGFRYAFIYPDSTTYPKNGDNEPVESKITNWIEQLKNNVSLAWLHNNKENTDRNQLSKKLNEFLTKLDSEIKFFQANLNTDIWLRLPSSYCVMYNLGLTDRGNKFRYGSFRIEGQLIRSPTRIDSIFSSGWLYTTDEQYKLIEDSCREGISDWTELTKEPNMEIQS